MPPADSPKQAILLFAHGSSDPEWARLFEDLRARVEARVPGRVVTLAYLERMKPSFDQAVDALKAEGVQSISVAPLFLAPGGHVREDLPRLIAAARIRSGMQFDVRPALGESATLLEGIARWIVDEDQA